jgi:hypothetical protein
MSAASDALAVIRGKFRTRLLMFDGYPCSMSKEIQPIF